MLAFAQSTLLPEKVDVLGEKVRFDARVSPNGRRTSCALFNNCAHPLIKKGGVTGTKVKRQSLHVDPLGARTFRQADTGRTQRKEERSVNWALWLIGFIVLGGITLWWCRPIRPTIETPQDPFPEGYPEDATH